MSWPPTLRRGMPSGSGSSPAGSRSSGPSSPSGPRSSRRRSSPSSAGSPSPAPRRPTSASATGRGRCCASCSGTWWRWCSGCRSPRWGWRSSRFRCSATRLALRIARTEPDMVATVKLLTALVLGPLYVAALALAAGRWLGPWWGVAVASRALPLALFTRRFLSPAGRGNPGRAALLRARQPLGPQAAAARRGAGPGRTGHGGRGRGAAPADA